MAKQKKPLSPEQAEIKAMKKEKNSKGWTKFWAILLALVLAAGTFVVGQTVAKKAVEAAGANAGAAGGQAQGGASTDEQLNANDENLLGGEELPEGEQPGEEGGVAFTKDNAHEMFNTWTAAAAKSSYKFTRVCAYTPDGAIDVGNATDTLNGVIQTIDKNASLSTVVGGFLGIGNREGDVKNGQIPEGMNEQYALKAMQLTAADIKAAAKSGNTYKVQLNACANPKKDNSNALSRATNDFFTHEEVVKGISDLTNLIKVTSTDVQYTSILLTATVEGDKMTSLEISYTFAATMNLKVGFAISGNGKATNKITYTIA